MSHGIYSFVDQDSLRHMVESFYECIHLPIQVIDETGHFLEAFGDTGNFCGIFQKHLPENDNCNQVHIKAAKRAIDFGEAYIFTCHSNLNHIVFPLIHKNGFLGSILLGPFLMDEPDSTMISDLSKKYRLNIEDTLELFEEVHSIPVVAPAQINHISRLLYFLFRNLIGEGKERLQQNSQKLIQQSLINESIQRYKDLPANKDSYPYEKEKELLSKVKTGNIQDAKAILNDLLGYVLFSEGNSLENIKTRSIELCSLLSRTAMEGGAPSDRTSKMNNTFMKNLQQVDSMESLCLELQEIVESFTESAFHFELQKNNDTINKSIKYISQYFNTPLTLPDVAANVHLHPAYFSALFKQSTGITFKDYLNKVRVEESKRLLANTDYSIIDIAIACGFEDQSYFSKVFKKYTGMTPKQYR